MMKWIDGKRQKYNNKKISYNGIVFDSRLEHECYLWLSTWSADIQVHKSFDLIVNNHKICVLKPDFVIKSGQVGAGEGTIVVDAKGTSRGGGNLSGGDSIKTKYKQSGTFTPEAKIKYKLFEALYGLRIFLYPCETMAILAEFERAGLQPRVKGGLYSHEFL